MYCDGKQKSMRDATSWGFYQPKTGASCHCTWYQVHTPRTEMRAEMQRSGTMSHPTLRCQMLLQYGNDRQLSSSVQSWCAVRCVDVVYCIRATAPVNNLFFVGLRVTLTWALTIVQRDFQFSRTDFGAINVSANKFT